jgi:hypothetical protein
MILDHKQKQSNWTQEKTELQNQKQQLELLNAQLAGNLRKKETEFQRLQVQLSKVMKESVRGKSGTMIIAPSNPISSSTTTGKTKSKTSSTADEMTPSQVYLLQQENIRLKNTLAHFNQEKLQLIDSIVNLKDEMRNMSSFASSQMLESSQSRSLVMNTPMAGETRVKDKLYACDLTTGEAHEQVSNMNTVVPKHHKYAESSAITPITVDVNAGSHHGGWLDRADADQSTFSHLSFSQQDFEPTPGDMLAIKMMSTRTPHSEESSLQTPSHPFTTKALNNTTTTSQGTKQVRFAVSTPHEHNASNLPTHSTPFNLKEEIESMVREEYENKLQSMYSSFETQQQYMMQGKC